MYVYFNILYDLRLSSLTINTGAKENDTMYSSVDGRNSNRSNDGKTGKRGEKEMTTSPYFVKLTEEDKKQMELWEKNFRLSKVKEKKEEEEQEPDNRWEVQSPKQTSK